MRDFPEGNKHASIIILSKSKMIRYNSSHSISKYVIRKKSEEKDQVDYEKKTIFFGNV